jgi:hypothetical protein
VKVRSIRRRIWHTKGWSASATDRLDLAVWAFELFGQALVFGHNGPMSTADSGKKRVPALDGWFTMDDDAPALLGSRCTVCGTFAFPAEQFACRNPACEGTEFEPVRLSRRGKVWSYTDARYQPPPPYVAADPYVPFTLAAVELAAEKMVVMGQVVPGVSVDDLTVGDEVELVLGTLYEDDDHEYLVWRWRPVASAENEGGADG